jgi:hypothetical protein
MVLAWPYFIGAIGFIFRIKAYPIPLFLTIALPCLIFSYLGWRGEKKRKLAELHDSFIKPKKTIQVRNNNF